jgi:phage baseplate assembly protein W
MSQAFIGRGWAFPVETDATGGIRLVGDETEIEQSIRLILSTAPGERPMRPGFGCAIHDYVFDPADARTALRLASAVRDSLRRWEPRIRYTTSDRNNPRNLVFPFYVIPGEG